MRKLLIIAVVLGLASPACAGFPGSSFFKSVMDKVSGGNGSSSSRDASDSDSKNDSNSGSDSDSGNDSGGGSGTWGKISAKEYLDSLPAVPADGCSAEGETALNFKEQVAKAVEPLQKEIELRQQRIHEIADKNRSGGEKLAMKKAGYGDMDPQDLKKKRSKKEQKELADKILKEKYGITQDQAKKLSKSSTENKAAFAQSIAAEKQADDLSKPQDQLEAEKKSEKNEAQVQEEFNAQQKKVAAFHLKYVQQLEKNKNDKAVQRLLKEIEKAQRERDDLVKNGSSGGQFKAVLKKIFDLQEQYCKTLAPKQLKVIQAYRSGIGDNMAQYQRLDELTSELQKVNIGVGTPDEGKGFSALTAVKGFASVLGNAYENDLTPYPEATDGSGVY